MPASTVVEPLDVADDVVASTVFLLSDAPRQITGRNIVVDGGLSDQ